MTSPRTNIELFRHLAGVTQGGLCALIEERTGRRIHQTTISKLERQERSPRVATAQAVASVIGVPTHLVTAAPEVGR